ncbi:hypothetical protein [Helcococcus sueciensis]|uniref:hypothetical protein n=1 Tax=Helcococcus sueciensis TaxID=241555 RepID=UPI0003FE25C3|nr:hypothetical protein [Helcococcus sueciensis]
MEQSIYKQLSENIENISEYTNEIEKTEEFFLSRKINKETLDEVFWNHLITLLERIDNDEQNDLEMDELDEISKEAKDLLDEYISEMNKIRNFDVNNFEKKLLSIYTQRMIQGV